MAQLGTITPQYQAPHVEFYVNDNTAYTPTTATVDPLVRSLHIFTSDKGRDGVILKMNSVSEYISEYGKMNYASHGQACYMPFATLSGGGSCYCMRITDPKSVYSSLMVVCGIKVDTDTQKIIMKFETRELTLSSESGISLAMNTHLQEGTNVDADGFNIYPLFCFYAAGRGSYGNNFRIRLTTDPISDKLYSFKNFALEVLSSESGLARLERFSGVSLFRDASIGSSSFFIEDAVNDDDTGSKYIRTVVDYSNYTSLINVIKGAKDIVSDKLEFIDESSVDFLFGTTGTTLTTGEVINLSEFIVYDTASVGTVTLDGANGLSLSSGYDGDLSSNIESSIRETAMDNLFINAYKGQINKAVKSKLRFPVEYMFDANHSEAVKTAMTDLCNAKNDGTSRNDCFLYLDAGIHNDTTSLVSWAQANTSKGDYHVSKEGQWYEIKDPYSGKRVPVTITYFLASILPAHVRNNAIDTPLVGSLYARLSGHIKNSLTPVIECAYYELKDQLQEARVNYFEAVAENTFTRANQITAQTDTSDLSQENNVRVLLTIKRELEAMAQSLLFNFNEASDRKSYTDAAGRLFQKYSGVIRSGSVRFDSTAHEEIRGILHCYAEIVFKSLVTNCIIEVDINPRA